MSRFLQVSFALLALCLSLCVARPGTSLESAFIRAYNERVEDGTWVSLYGNNGLLNQDFCPGSTSIWPWPSAIAGTDLYNALQNGVFRCAYNGGQLITAPTGAVVLNTTGYASNARPNGLTVDWFDKLAASISAQYQVPFTISWTTSFTSSNDIEAAILKGDLDAGCGGFSVGAGYSTYGARGNVFSVFFCPTYLQNPLIYMSTSDSVSTWAAFIDKVNNGWIVYAYGSPGGGTEQSCTALLNQYTTGAQCFGNLTAFTALQNGNCNAVYSGSTAPSSFTFASLSAPVINAQGTLFRPTDVNGAALATTVINVNIA